MLAGRDIVSISDLSKKEIGHLLERSAEMEEALAGSNLRIAENKILALVFMEPSTRTRMSFNAAMLRLGGDVLTMESVATSSIAKGESFSDTIRIIDGYCDALVLRHSVAGSAQEAAGVCAHPLINGGDGDNQHPTQTLLDLYAIKKATGRISGLNVALVGDLKHGRAMRSLLHALAMFGNSMMLLAPAGLEMDKRIVAEARKSGSRITESNDVAAFKSADIAYVCRIQEERYAEAEVARIMRKQFRISAEMLKGANPALKILHPLPRHGETDPAIDATGHAFYFEQAKLGVPVRMAILAEVLGV
jgi:aspartate carbamoyltransferase catalytic subunit